MKFDAVTVYPFGCAISLICQFSGCLGMRISFGICLKHLILGTIFQDMFNQCPEETFKPVEPVNKCSIRWQIRKPVSETVLSILVNFPDFRVFVYPLLFFFEPASQFCGKSSSISSMVIDCCRSRRVSSFTHSSPFLVRPRLSPGFYVPDTSAILFFF